MQNIYGAERVINGTYGEVWVDDEYIAEVTGLEAKISIDKSDVQMVRKLGKGQKVTGLSGKGTLKCNKVRSYIMKTISDALKKGKQAQCNIVSKLEDPDSFGAEKVLLKNCSFDELTLVDFEAGKLGEESIAFTFDDWDLIDTIDVTFTQPYDA